MNEHLVQFGDQRRLNGILTLPAQVTSPMVVILPNAGILHRVGAGRISVQLARRFAGQGVASLRFDYTGIGDSGPRDGASLEQENCQELIMAMDHLGAELGSQRFVLLGLCSGARDAFQAALLDSRVVGVAQIDGYAYRNTRYYLQRFRLRVLPRLLNGQSWRKFISRCLQARSETGRAKPESREPDSYTTLVYQPYPERRQIEAGYDTLSRRGVHFFVLFTGSWEDQYNYRNQFFDMYPSVNFRGLLRLEHWPNATHTLRHARDQAALLDSVSDWLSRLSPGPDMDLNPANSSHNGKGYGF